MKEIDIQQFNDLAECTEYFYDELGKLNSVKEKGHLNKKEIKKLHNIVMNSFLSVMGNLKFKADVSNKIDKVTTKEAKEDFQKEHNTGLIQKTAKVIKITSTKVGGVIGTAFKLMLPKSKRPTKVDILTEEEARKIGQGHTDTSLPALPEGEKKEEDMQQDEKNKEDKELSQSEEKID